MARGDGTFKVSKYAFGDDEIDYNSYEPKHLSGSAYCDLEILQTPILEAFTNNRSSLKHRLTSLTNNNLLYLPILKINEVGDGSSPSTAMPDNTTISTNSYVVLTDEDTYTESSVETEAVDFIWGHTIAGEATSHIMIDQGLDTTELDAGVNMTAELTERQYMIEIDNRLGTIYDIVKGDAIGSPSFIDDDQIATYFISQGVGDWIKPLLPGALGGTEKTAEQAKGGNVIAGPRGTRLQFSIQSSDFLRGSDYLFDTIGGTLLGVTSKPYKYIDTTVKVTGLSTGYSLDLPVRFLKYDD